MNCIISNYIHIPRSNCGVGSQHQEGCISKVRECVAFGVVVGRDVVDGSFDAGRCSGGAGGDGGTVGRAGRCGRGGEEAVAMGLMEMDSEHSVDLRNNIERAVARASNRI